MQENNILACQIAFGDISPPTARKYHKSYFENYKQLI